MLGMAPATDDKKFRKAITTASAPTIIQTTEAERLIDLIVDQSKLWQQATVIRMDRCSQTVRFIDLTAGILRPKVCGTPHDTASITATACELNTVELVVQFPICDDVLDCNIDGVALEAHILEMATKVMANELEIWALMSNTDGSYNSPFLDDSVEHLIDGWYQQLQTGHVLNAAAATDTSGCAIHPCKFTDLLKALPTKWRMDPGSLRFYMPSNMLLDWYTHISARGTPLGDSVLTGCATPSWGCVPIVDIPLLPTDLTSCNFGSFAAADRTFMFLTDPKNLILGIQKDITYERWREGNANRTWHQWKIRVDAQICVPDATALYDCMCIGDCAELYCQAPVCA